MSDLLADHRMLELRAVEWNDSAGTRTPSGIRVNADNSMACSAYTACIRVISDAVSSLPLHVFERLPNGGKRKATEHPIYRLLHMQPNPWQTAQEFRDWMSGMYLHFGASYAEIRPGSRGAVSELWPLHSSRMDPPERLENGRLRYAYREPSGKRTFYDQSQIFALRFTTEDGVRPIPTYKIFQNAIGLAQALEAHGSAYFGNGARPGIVLESDNPIPAEAAERLREQWERMHRGPGAFRTAVLPNGVKAHELSGSNEAAQFLETRQYQVIEICRAFRVPPHMIQDLTRSTFSNIEVQGTEFVQHCLMPHLKRWEAAISRDLIVDDERYFAEHSVSGLLRGDHAARSAYYVSALQNGWMSINEIRELENLNPIGPEGDRHYIQLNMTTLDKAGEQPAGPAAEPVAEVEDSPEDDAEDAAQEQADG